ncbi:MAG: hypothetical protein KIS87_03140 [Phycisphaeraceae bacterium]|nr:hypothetical protein [Phycisphaeraceae bacterium]
MMRWLRERWLRDLAIHRERRAKWLRERKMLCPRCGYDVTVPTGPRCPECGLEHDPAWREEWPAVGSRWRYACSAVCLAVSGTVIVGLFLVLGVLLAAVVATAAEERGVVSDSQAMMLAMTIVIGSLALPWIALICAYSRLERRYVFGPRIRLVRLAITSAIICTLTIVAWNLKPWF